jgi:hypothetical protein
MHDSHRGRISYQSNTWATILVSVDEGRTGILQGYSEDAALSLANDCKMIHEMELIKRSILCKL